MTKILMKKMRCRLESISFAYWLQGFFEISNKKGQELSAQQVQIIKDHLALVFKKETPTYATTTAVKLCSSVPYIDPNGRYKEDTGGIRMTPLFCGDRIQDGWPNGILPHYTGIDEMERANNWVNSKSDPDNLLKDISIESGPQNPENWKNQHSYKWDIDRKVWTVDINPHTPVEITQTYDGNVAFWPQASC